MTTAAPAVKKSSFCTHLAPWGFFTLWKGDEKEHFCSSPNFSAQVFICESRAITIVLTYLPADFSGNFAEIRRTKAGGDVTGEVKEEGKEPLPRNN